ncbi:MAG: HEAT repeat domain-containing protein, partial [Planctomycetota bacterium]
MSPSSFATGRRRWWRRALTPTSCALAVVCLLLAACGGSDPAEAEPTPAEVEALLLGHPELVALFNECVRDTYYETDTSNPVSFLIPKLMTGRGLPMNRAVESLGRLGEESIDELVALLREQKNDPQQMGAIHNVVGAIGQNPSPKATEALFEALGHPQSSVRVTALRALGDRPLHTRHFDLAEQALYTSTGIETSLLVGVMMRADPRRTKNSAVGSSSLPKSPSPSHSRNSC